MYCLSVSHKTSNVVVRKKLAFPDEQKRHFLTNFIILKYQRVFDSLHLQQNRGLFCGDESSVKTVETVLSDFRELILTN